MQCVVWICTFSFNAYGRKTTLSAAHMYVLWPQWFNTKRLASLQKFVMKQNTPLSLSIYLVNVSVRHFEGGNEYLHSCCQRPVPCPVQTSKRSLCFRHCNRHSWDSTITTSWATPATPNTRKTLYTGGRLSCL